VAFGEAVTVGGRRFRCEDARGHDPFHCVWHDEAYDRLVTGDIVLGLPTPLLERIGDNMTRYRATLQRWQQAPEPALILPGHGRPSVGLGRALERSLGYLEAGYALTVGFLEAAEPVEPLGAVLESFETLGPAQFQVAFIRLANTMSQLDEMALLGLVEQREDLRWRRTGPLPSYADYLPLVERL
jgi:glyoxylase-like metal-dependent hydrolase (beta-lactamase superfamily II)